MKKKQERRSFSREFKLEAVRQVIEEGRPLAQVARDLGMGAGLLGRWKRELLDDREEAFPGKGQLKVAEEELRRLEPENRRLRQEVEFLKKNGNLLREGTLARFRMIVAPSCSWFALHTIACRNTSRARRRNAPKILKRLPFQELRPTETGSHVTQPCPAEHRTPPACLLPARVDLAAHLAHHARGQGTFMFLEESLDRCNIPLGEFT